MEVFINPHAKFQSVSNLRVFYNKLNINCSIIYLIICLIIIVKQFSMV